MGINHFTQCKKRGFVWLYTQQRQNWDVNPGYTGTVQAYRPIPI